MCTFRKVIKYINAKVDVPKGALKCRENLRIDVLVSSNSHFHPLVSYGYNPQWLPLSILVRVCIWVLGQARGSWSAQWAPMSFALHVVAKLLCYCLCLFNVVIE